MKALPASAKRYALVVGVAAVIPPDGLLLISFAGHGIEREGQEFLLPADAQVSNDVDLLEQTAINVSQIKDRVKKIGVKQVLMILDACRNDPAEPIKGTWKQAGNDVQIVIGNSYSVLQGILEGGVMKGNGTN